MGSEDAVAEAARQPAPLGGLLNTNKPAGITSRRVVDRVVRMRRGLKAGHAGTLDPLASGVLVVCVGAATRLIEYVQRTPKTYDGTFLLGRQSPTEDVDGEVVELRDPPIPARDAIERAAASLVGTIQQRPPAFSALKIEGRRAYDLARKGAAVDLAPREIVVHRLDVVSYDYPELRLHVECGSGTYVRSLGRDLAERLGTAAVMSRLVRTAIGRFRIEDAIDPETLDPQTWTRHLLPPLAALDGLQRIELTATEAVRVRSGQPVVREGLASGEVAAIDPDGALTAILAPRADGRWWPMRTFPGEG
jgi:tRNA pseudouridine55 synthase